MLIRARAPLRLGLAGGGTDVAPYCDMHGGLVLNGTIDRYAYAVIRTSTEPVVRLVASDQQRELTSAVSVPFQRDDPLPLHRTVYDEMMKRYNNGERIALELSTFCDAPAGSGLGSSSTLVVVMIRSFAELLNLPLDDYHIAQLAFQIERVICGFQGGRQDHYSATFGGFNFMEFYADERATINSLRVKNWIICELEASLLMFYTGVSRESAKIIAAQSGNVKAGAVETIEAMHALKASAAAMKDCLLKGDFAGIVESIRESWASKKRTADSVSNPMIEEIFESASGAGALGGKISGAGGGGFMWFFVPPEKRMNVTRALNKFEGHVSNCHFTKHGTQAWRV